MLERFWIPLIVGLVGCTSLPGREVMLDPDRDGSPFGEDCDDRDSSVYPGAEDIPYDGVDADCAGDDDYDLDGDGFVTDPAHIGLKTTGVPYSGQAQAAGDCWDDPGMIRDAFQPMNGYPALTAAAVRPGAVDVPYDGIDADCAGDSDFDADGDGFAAALYLDRSGVFGDDCFDRDEDGYSDAVDPDTVYPGAEEFCGDVMDSDCDDLADEEDPDASPKIWHADFDSDGYGDPDRMIQACDPPDGYVRDNTDCDDRHASTNPAAEERCDGVDND